MSKPTKRNARSSKPGLPWKPQISMQGSYLGPHFSQNTIEKEFTYCGAEFQTLTEEEMIEQTAQALSIRKDRRKVLTRPIFNGYMIIRILLNANP